MVQLPPDPDYPLPFLPPSQSPFVPAGVAPIAAPGKRSLLGDFGRSFVRNAAFDFAGPQDVLPYRPNALTQFTTALKAGLTGMTGASKRKAELDQTEAEAARRQTLVDLEGKKVGLQERQVQQAEEGLMMTARRDALKFLQDNPAAGKFLRDAGLNAVEAISGFQLGKLPKEQMDALGQGLAEMSGNAMLPKLMQEAGAFAELELGPDALPEERAKARQKTAAELMRHGLDPLGAAMFEADLRERQAKYWDAQVAALGQQTTETASANKRAALASLGDAINGAQATLTNLTRIAFGEQGAGIGQMLLGLGGNNQAEQLSQLPTLATPEAKKAIQQIPNMLDSVRRLSAARDTLIKALGDVEVEQLKTAPPPPPPGTNPATVPPMLAPVVRGEGPVFPAIRVPVDQTAALLQRGLATEDAANPILSHYLGSIEQFVDPETGTDLSKFPTAQRVQFAKFVAKRYGPEAAELWMLRMLVGDDRLKEEYGTEEVPPDFVDKLLSGKAYPKGKPGSQGSILNRF